MRKPRVSAIIPVYNEEKTISKIISTLLKDSFINEVICVNDGSTDKSLPILKSFKNRITVINLRKNRGKGFALAEGIKIAKGDIVAFFDADLIYFSHTHIKTLLSPLLNSKIKGVVGYIPTGNMMEKILFKDLCGERAYFRNDLLPHLKQFAKTGYGVEVFFNNLFTKSQIKRVRLDNLDLLVKHKKLTNKQQIIKDYVKEAKEIVTELAIQEGLWPRDYQILKSVHTRTIRYVILQTRKW